jgi:uncharacterized protein (DUF1697 family)
MIYVALLRGINVGGKARVEMPKLKAIFERLGHTDVVTYINSGNVIFTANATSPHQLSQAIEAAIEADFGFAVPVVLRSREQIKQICDRVPADWINDGQTMKTDVMFLWKKYDSPDAISYFKYKPEIEQLVYVGGALVWNITREYITRGSVIKMIGTDIYKHMTVRNINTVRKLSDLCG